MASIVTIAPVNSRISSNLGMAVISLLLSSTGISPKTRRFSAAQALTRCNAGRSWAESKERRRVLPSIGTICPRVISWRARTQATKQSWNLRASRSWRAREKVSWDGMPLGSARKVFNHSRLARP